MCDYALDHYFDDQTGMFWYTSDIDPPLIARKQEIMDNVIPSSNSTMAINLFRVGTLLDRTHYQKTSRQMLSNVLPHIDYGQSFSNWGILHLYMSHPYFEVAITGTDHRLLQQDLAAKYLPNVLYLGAESSSSLPLLEGKFLDTSTVFVCVDRSCKIPVENAEDALEQILDYK